MEIINIILNDGTTKEVKAKKLGNYAIHKSFSFSSYSFKWEISLGPEKYLGIFLAKLKKDAVKIMKEFHESFPNITSFDPQVTKLIKDKYYEIKEKYSINGASNELP